MKPSIDSSSAEVSASERSCHEGDRPSVYEVAGAEPVITALASVLHERCLEDPMLNHPFPNPLHPQHLDHLAGNLAEVFGGPSLYSQSLGDHSAMLHVHTATGVTTTRRRASSNASLKPPPTVACRETRSSEAFGAHITWAVSQVHSHARSIRSYPKV